MTKGLSLNVGMIIWFACVVLLFLMATGRVEGRTITVDDDGEAEFASIQDAINASVDGDTIRVWEGVYDENITISKPIELIGNGTESKIRSSGPSPVVNSTSPNVTLSNVRIIFLGEKENVAGVQVGGNHTTIENTSCTNAYYGIRLVEVGDCSIIGNTVTDCNRAGISLQSAWNVTLEGNRCEYNSGPGISIGLSSWIEVRNNSCHNNEWGIAGTWAFYVNVSNNRCDRNSLYGIHGGWGTKYWNVTTNECDQNEVGIIIELNDAFLKKNSCTNSEVSGLIVLGDSASIMDMECRNGLFGMQIQGSKNSVFGGTFSKNRDGVQVSSQNNVFQNLSLIDNLIGFYLRGTNISISQCVITNNAWGIVDNYAKNVILSDNEIAGNVEGGLYLQSRATYLATDNWWGHESGPYHEKENRQGRGDEISGTVQFRPWSITSESGIFSSHRRSDDKDDGPLWIFGVVGVTSLGFIGLLGGAYFREDIRFLLLSLLPSPLYTKLERDEILDHPNRREVYSYIVNQPGSNLSRLHAKLPIGYGTLVHHLKVLEREKHVRSKKEMGRKLFFPTGTDWLAVKQEREKSTCVNGIPPSDVEGGGQEQRGQTNGAGGRPDPLGNLSSVPVGLRIVEHLKEHGPATQGELEEELGIPLTTVSYNLRNLVGDGKVGKCPGSKGALYELKMER